ncbi:MAG: ATP-binding cassette domain-containing protein, partial [Anaerolineae bacterium]
MWRAACGELIATRYLPLATLQKMTQPIKLNALGREFQRGETAVAALRGLDLTIAPGEFVALVGPSGSGKSTLLNLLGGLDRPSAGELWLNGLPLHDADAKARTQHRKERVGFIFQSFNLLPRLTAQENVALPLTLAGVPKVEREARARALLERVGLGHRLDHYPAELSGGEQQRTAVARALIHHPQLILADEPTGNLDSATGESIMNLLRDLNREQGITLIVVTHDPDVAAYADRVVRLRDGQITAIESQPSNKPTNHPTSQPISTPSGHLTFRDIVQTAVRNLGRRPVRNVLTAGGVLIGIITLVSMVSFGVGVQREVQRNFDTIGLENLFVSPTFAETDGFDPFAEPEPETPITPDLVAQIERLDEVEGVTPTIGMPFGLDLSLTLAGDSYPVRIEGGGGTPFRFGPPGTQDMLAGTDLPPGGSGIILSAGLADQMLTDDQNYDDLINQTVTLIAQLPRGESADFPTTIVGVQNGFSTRALDIG